MEAIVTALKWRVKTLRRFFSKGERRRSIFVCARRQGRVYSSPASSFPPRHASAMNRLLTLPFLAVASLLTSAPHAFAADPLFGREVVPILYKLGCSSGSCHGSFSGKGGFRLSLFASDP